MPFENSAGIGVSAFYGARNTGGAIGVETTQDSVSNLVIDITGAMLNGTFAPPVVLPKGALVKSYRLRVDEAFNLGGTSPTVRFGSAGSVATNGVVLTEAELENVGTKVPASAGAGTWSTTSATGLAAAAKVAFDMGGTSPTASATQGKAQLIIEFVNRTRA
jgi:hypothetical protein